MITLYIAGGCGEHGRNCFYVRTDHHCFLVDCGVMPDTGHEEYRYPRLSQEQIRSIDGIFLTHSHADHSGGLEWIKAQGFHGPVIATRQTITQLPAFANDVIYLEDIAPDGSGCFHGINLIWGRSGHCCGSVWYHFTDHDKSILFSGDYTEDTLAYQCDLIRGQSADLAVLDCAYGSRHKLSYEAACSSLIRLIRTALNQNQPVFLPVPKYGRGLELLMLFASNHIDTRYYGDDTFMQNLSDQSRDSFWYRSPELSNIQNLESFHGQDHGILFISDPQLRCKTAQQSVCQILNRGGCGIMTGTVEAGSFSDALIHQDFMTLCTYPVHLNETQYYQLSEQNNFKQAIPYHSEEYPVRADITL